jgi:dipeptide/tripeptide permease
VVDAFLAGIATLSLKELLTWMLLIFLVLIITIGILNISTTFMTYALNIMRKILKALIVLVPIFLVAFWVLSDQRPCSFQGEGAFTGCVSEEEIAKRQAEKK